MQPSSRNVLRGLSYAPNELVAALLELSAAYGENFSRTMFLNSICQQQIWFPDQIFSETFSLLQV